MELAALRDKLPKLVRAIIDTYLLSLKVGVDSTGKARTGEKR